MQRDVRVIAIRQMVAALLASPLHPDELGVVADALLFDTEFREEFARALLTVSDAFAQHHVKVAHKHDPGLESADFQRLEIAAMKSPLTNRELTEILARTPGMSHWKPNPKASRKQIVTTFARAAEPAAIHRALLEVEGSGKADPFLDELMNRSSKHE